MHTDCFISVALIKYPDKRQLKGKDLLQLTIPGYSLLWEGLRIVVISSVKSRETRAYVLTCLLACPRFLSPLTQFQSGSKTTHSEGTPPTCINLIMIPKDSPMGQPNIDCPSVRLYSQVIIGCVDN